MRWQDVEQDCLAFLNGRYGDLAGFELQGGSDSSKSDILVSPNGESPFFIEVKSDIAQCGQFVLRADHSRKEFSYSDRNADPIYQSTDTIIRHMNRHYDRYEGVGTSGIEIKFDGCRDVFNEWVISHYEHKQACLVITEDHDVIPLGQVGDFFDITATYRIKRSGSRHTGKKNIPSLLERFQYDADVTSCRVDGDMLIITMSAPPNTGTLSTTVRRSSCQNYRTVGTLSDDSRTRRTRTSSSR